MVWFIINFTSTHLEWSLQFGSSVSPPMTKYFYYKFTYLRISHMHDIKLCPYITASQQPVLQIKVYTSIIQLST